MKKTLKYLFILTCSLASVVSCARFDEQSVPEQETKVKMTFTAQIEGDAETRTVLGGKMGDEYRKVLWQPGDSIGVLNNLGYEYMHKFVNIEDEVSEISTFEGETYYGDTYYMFYPYSNKLYARHYDRIEFSIPSMQAYAKESFASNAMPMVAKGSPYSTIQFYSLCGVLALNITGSETVQSISFTGKDANGNPMPIAGDYYVNMNYENEPEIFTRDYDSPTHSATVTLNCGNGVALKDSEPTPFYIVLPPATYDSFNITIATTDGKVMFKESTNPLTIKRANATKTGALTYVANETIDLSTLGTANSYIVTASGLYSINATVIGNGEFGFVDGEPFHTSESTIEPASAKLIWEDTPGVIGGVTFSGGRLNFMATGVEGNALVAATDANDNILWSWHIWSTDQPVEQTYVNSTGTYVMLDRNIGAISADRGTSEEDWKNSIGVYYQWGRKDPFAYEKYTGVNTQLFLTESIENPTYYATGYGQWAKEWTKNLWSTDQKTIYDPCPVGYRVAISEVWSGFSKTGEAADRTKNMNIAESFDHGWYFYINDNSDTAWYPATSQIGYWGGLGYSSNYGYIWSAYNNGGDSSRVLYYYYNSDMECHLDPYNDYESSLYGNPVRCMKDDNATSVAVNIQSASESVSDITATSAKVSATVAYQGDITIERAGIVYGTSSSVSLNNGECVDADVTSGKFTVTLDNLKSLKKYYAKAFAVASDGNTYYSNKTISFITPNDGGVIDLSVGGTANCYIVYPVKGIYAFDLVKGNTLESVGEVASVDVLWETYNNNSVVAVGSVVSSATLEDGKAKFEIPEGAVSGNALIAAKDADGTILWSWHIWVADYDPVQTQQTYATGAIMMDRNLGATSVKPGTVESYGFFYQWGRKDPFVVPEYMTTAPVDAIVYEYYKSSNDTIENATQHPTTVYDDADWGGVDDLWSSTNVKTIYDPCPAGWKVSDKNAWGDSINRADNSQYGYFQIAPEYATPTAYIPLPGYSEGSDTIINNTSEGHIWLSERGYMMYFWVWNSSARPNSNYGVDQLMGVRCMKMDDGTKPGSGENVEVDDDYEW